MTNTDRSSGTRFLIGIIFIIVGGIFLLNTLDIFQVDVGNIIFSFPFLVFFVGLIILVNSNNRGFGLLVTVVGALLLIPRIFPDVDLSSNLVIGIIIIGFGLYIIFKRRTPQTSFHFKSTEKSDIDTFDEVSIFAGGHKIITSDNFKGGKITNIFGGAEIDLTACKLAEGTSVIDVLKIFGGTTLIVPRDWNIKLDITPIFGGFSNKMRRDPTLPVDMTRTLVIRGVTVFGGGEIKSF